MGAYPACLLSPEGSDCRKNIIYSGWIPELGSGLFPHSVYWSHFHLLVVLCLQKYFCQKITEMFFQTLSTWSVCNNNNIKQSQNMWLKHVLLLSSLLGVAQICYHLLHIFSRESALLAYVSKFCQSICYADNLVLSFAMVRHDVEITKAMPV